MAHLFHIDGEVWSRTALGGAVLLSAGKVAPLDRREINAVRHGVLISPVGTGPSDEQWILLASLEARVHVNDTPLRCGIRLLAHRDAIRLPGQSSLFFSSERIAEMEAFSSTEPMFCPRCKLPIEDGVAAVRCPQCFVWHHQQEAEGRACWTYAETCALCNQSTDLEAGRLRWSPENL